MIADTELIVTWIVGAAGLIGHAAIVYYKTNQNDQGIRDLWKWKEAHTKESEAVRREYDQELTALKVATAGTQQFMQEVLRRLSNIELILQKQRKGEHQ